MNRNEFKLFSAGLAGANNTFATLPTQEQIDAHFCHFSITAGHAIARVIRKNWALFVEYFSSVAVNEGAAHQRYSEFWAQYGGSQ